MRVLVKRRESKYVTRRTITVLVVTAVCLCILGGMTLLVGNTIHMLVTLVVQLGHMLGRC